MNGLSLALVLIFVFVVSGLSVQLFYVLWYRRKFRQESMAGEEDLERSVSVISSAFAAESYNSHGLSTHLPPPAPPSKELILYYLCLKNQSPVEPVTTSPTFTTAVPPSLPPDFERPLPPPPPLPPRPAEEEDDDDDNDDKELEKFRRLYTSRMLYTITEEVKNSPERIQVEVDDQMDVLITDALNVGDRTEDEEEINEIHFSSACASPFYTTPMSSPPRPPLAMDTDSGVMVG